MEITLDTLQKFIDQKRLEKWISKKSVYDVRNWMPEIREYEKNEIKKRKRHHLDEYWNP